MTEVPAAAALIRDLVNTVDLQDTVEQLTDPDALRAWFVDRALLAADSTVTAADLARVRAVREGFRQVLASHAGHDVDADALARSNRALAGVPLHAEFDAAGGCRWRAGRAGADQAVARLLDAVHACTVDGTWDRLKVCTKDSCRWAFFDASRNRSGRWCSMAECGNKVKMQRAHAARRRRT